MAAVCNGMGLKDKTRDNKLNRKETRIGDGGLWVDMSDGAGSGVGNLVGLVAPERERKLKLEVQRAAGISPHMIIVACEVRKPKALQK